MKIYGWHPRRTTKIEVLKLMAEKEIFPDKLIAALLLMSD
jgi:hypothetical protein